MNADRKMQNAIPLLLLRRIAVPCVGFVVRILRFAKPMNVGRAGRSFVGRRRRGCLLLCFVGRSCGRRGRSLIA